MALMLISSTSAQSSVLYAPPLHQQHSHPGRQLQDSLLQKAESAVQHRFVQLSQQPQGSGPVELGILKVLLALALVLIAVGLSVYLSLGLHKSLAIAAGRCIVQLTALGYILVPIFEYNQWWLVLLYALFMLAVAAAEAISRPAVAFDGMLSQVLAALGSSSALVIMYSMLLVIRPHPVWDAQYLIPTFGMLLGNAISCISIGLSTALEELTVGKDRVELLLALGASRLEATRSLLQHSVATALTPVLNQMAVIGLVSIPGMMTGQILGGSSPAQAARYQMVIMFMITGTASMGTVATVLGAVLTAVDRQHRLRSERLIPRANRQKGVAHWVQAQVIKGFVKANTVVRRVLVRLRLARGTGGGRGGRSSGWMVSSPIARRMFGGTQSRRPSRLSVHDDQDGGQLHDVIIGSDDEMESVLSGPMSDQGDMSHDRESTGLLENRRQASLGSRP